MIDEQDEVIAFLSDPRSYPDAAGPVELVETHASLVFLAGRRAYKLKRAVKYSYLDFSTLPLRHAACATELRLNRRTAPQLYLEVRAISRLPDGSLAWGRVGDAVDFVVVMQRFDQSAVFDQVAARGELTPPLLYSLSAHISAFHKKAQPCPEHGGGAAMRDLAQTNIGIVRGIAAAGFEAMQIDRVEQMLAAELTRVELLLDERRQAGKVRRGHGDLHLRNVCVIEGEPLLFDAIEFSEAIASIDVLYDLAFLLMDFEHRGLRGFANLVFNRYLDLSGEDDGIGTMRSFIALRALVRAHVTATMAEHGWGGTDSAAGFAEARRYLADAEAALTFVPARIVAVGGLSGSGKSTLAAALAVELGCRPGARILRSDVRRKLLLGGAPETPLPAEAYTPAITARVYHGLCEGALSALRGGYSAVIDAVSLRPDERAVFAGVAAAAGVPFTGLWLDAAPENMAARIGARKGDASDASQQVLDQQLRDDPGPLDWIRLDSNGDTAGTLAQARRALVH
jgi:aminoglycoside phosphotransferase family enzyme/predicted kinase